MIDFIGIDPGAKHTGASGGIALIAADGTVEATDLPLHPRGKPTKKKGKLRYPPALVNGYELGRILSAFDPDKTVIAIEKVGARPKQGVSSTFNFGNTAGAVRGVCEAKGFRTIVYPTPQQWKKRHGLIGTVKDASRVLALKKYPALQKALKRKRDGGRADAVLIADWCRTVH